MWMIGLLVSLNSNAAILVDTGTPPSVVPGPGNGPALLSASQWLAAKFTLAESAILTDLEGYIGGTFYSPVANSGFHIAIRSVEGSLPGNELYSGSSVVPRTLFGDWYGVHGVSWALAAGDYFISFEIRPGDASASMPRHAPSPLGTEAFTNNGTWLSDNRTDIGVRIYGGSVSAVPEPESYVMLMAGLGLLAVTARRRKFTSSSQCSRCPSH